MIEYLSFEYCKKTEESHAFFLYSEDDGYYCLQTRSGHRGIYFLTDDFIKNYRMKGEELLPMFEAIEATRIYSWRKAFPAGYVPGEPVIGCDIGSWSLDYKECHKQNTRHIRGKGNIMETFPEIEMLEVFDFFFPDFDFIKWISEKS